MNTRLAAIAAFGRDAALVERARGRMVAARAEAGLPVGVGWYDVRNEAGDGVPEVLIYGAIGGFWPGDIIPFEFAAELKAIDAPEIRVKIDSPGGFVFDGVTVYNLLRDHPARIHVVVDGMAASAASFVAQAGDQRTMNRASEMMIHDAWGLAIGNAEEMREMADFLDRQTLKIAGIYAARSGRPVDGWLEAMSTETWYFADEAVAAGLADDAISDDDAEPSGGAEDRTTTEVAEALYRGRDTASDVEISTDTAPEAPEPPAADEAARDTAARQRRHAVAQAEAALALASTT
jgi:ATP-dependent protease ClpP protease subunit